MFPDTMPADSKGWATSCPTRRPQFKIHTSKGLAMSAISDKRPNFPIALYRLNGENWVLEKAYLVPQNCERCGRDFRSFMHSYRYIADNQPGQNLPKHELPIICHHCYSEDKQRRYDESKREQERAEYERLRKQFEGS